MERMATEKLVSAINMYNELDFPNKVATIDAEGVELPYEVMRNAFLDIIENIPQDQVAPLKGEVADVYDALVGEWEAEAAEKKKDVDAKKEKKLKEPKAPKEKKERKAKGERKIGVIETIFLTVKAKGPVTMSEIHDVLVSTFPERNADSMKTTVKIQLGGKKRPLRLEESRGVTFVVEDGKFSFPQS